MGGRCDEAALNATVDEWRRPLTVDGLPVAYETFTYFMMGNCAIRRSVFDRIGWFDERLIRGGEEIEFSIRAPRDFPAIRSIGFPTRSCTTGTRPRSRGIMRQFFLLWPRGRRRASTAIRGVANLPPKRSRQTARSVWSLLMSPQALTPTRLARRVAAACELHRWPSEGKRAAAAVWYIG